MDCKVQEWWLWCEFSSVANIYALTRSWAFYYLNAIAMWCVCLFFFLSGICSVSQGKMNLNRFFVHQSDRAIAVFFSHSKMKWFSLRLEMNRRTFNSHGVTWKSNTNPVNGSHRIDLNRMLRLLFFNWFFFRWNAFEIGWSHTFTHTCLLGIVHTTHRSPGMTRPIIPYWSFVIID